MWRTASHRTEPCEVMETEFGFCNLYSLLEFVSRSTAFNSAVSLGQGAADNENDPGYLK